MQRHHLKKISGFFLIEILVVLVIIGILVVAMTPSYITYTNRAKFTDVVNQANALKASVEACILRLNSDFGCNSGFNGIPADNAALNTGYVSGFTINNGVIRVSSQGITVGNASSFTYVLNPTLRLNGVVTWVVDSRTSTCIEAGLCSGGLPGGTLDVASPPGSSLVRV